MTNKKVIVIVSDIFGSTPALNEFALAIADGQQSIIIEPYQGQQMIFSCEQSAYQYFTEHVGLENYVIEAKRQLSRLSDVDVVIGFSIGGSVLWQLSAQAPQLLSSDLNMAFYASQIRNMTELKPQVPIELIMPKSETHFDVAALAKKLVTYPKVKVRHTSYLHGFINRCSDNFSLQGYQQFCQQLKPLVTK
ncbi:hypothetical protein tinsulaeT_27730 [Thalassotalea insulae]|uniref:Dienelactone hydrolase domain-containing protein n=1 Tax=Thalassotalea insulae TaxID=2056778 RepID=A0ABQ6GU26_9GAMM|nr:dienelactone hydrolase family protein [Thalassotalea insulae]GLX79433.1 hypothetical protein tinsulaeT_27730 [Thalassotalea insulae]